jgi:hypothetical protein
MTIETQPGVAARSAGADAAPGAAAPVVAPAVAAPAAPVAPPAAPVAPVATPPAAPAATSPGTPPAAAATLLGADAPADPAATAAAEAAAAAAAAPEPIVYQEFKLPEGMTADAEGLASFKEAAAGLKLSQEQAQQLVGLYAARQAAAAEAAQAAQVALTQSWAEATKADAECGGPKLDAAVAHAQRALDRFGTPALRATLRDGLGNHPEIIRVFSRIGAALGESEFVQGNGAAAPPVSVAKRLYPTMNPGKT